MVAPKGRAGDRPRQRTDYAVSISCLICWRRGRSISPGEETNLTPLALAAAISSSASVHGRRHGLVEVDMDAVIHRQHALLIVHADRASDGDGVHTARGQHFLYGRVGGGHAELGRCRLGPLQHRIAHRGDAHAIAHIGHGQVWKMAAQGNAARADNA